MHYMVDPLPHGLQSPQRPFLIPDVDVGHCYRQRLEELKEAGEDTSQSVWAELQALQDLPLCLHITSLVDEHWRPQFHRAFLEDWGEPLLPAPLGTSLYIPQNLMSGMACTGRAISFCRDTAQRIQTTRSVCASFATSPWLPFPHQKTVVTTSIRTSIPCGSAYVNYMALMGMAWRDVHQLQGASIMPDEIARHLSLTRTISST